MPNLLLLAITLLQTTGLAQTSLISWNIRDFGQSKSDAEIRQIAQILRDADLVALQEVVAGPGGAQAVARLPGLYPTETVVIAGDFNASETSDAFQEFYKQGYCPALRDQKTTLKRSCDEGYLNHAIDNIYFPEKKIALLKAEAVDFVDNCQNLEAARGVSDHLPVRVEW